MNNKQQTAVEWLSEIDKYRHITIEEWEQAKEMHKEEIINAHTIGYVIGGGNGYIHEPEQYYNETYVGNK
jgi:hypothetical protein